MKAQRVMGPLYGLSCGGGGVLRIERSLARTPGVVHANPATAMASISYDPEQVTLEQCVKAIEQVGFRAGAPSVQ